MAKFKITIEGPSIIEAEILTSWADLDRAFG